MAKPLKPASGTCLCCDGPLVMTSRDRGDLTWVRRLRRPGLCDYPPLDGRVMDRRYGIVSRLDKDDVWMLRQFRSTPEEAAAAEVGTASDIIGLGWAKGETAIITFDLDALTRLERFRREAGAAAGEVAMVMDTDMTRLLGARTHSRARYVNEVTGQA